MTDPTPAGVNLLSHLDRLRLRFGSEASLVATGAQDDPATLEWSCSAVLRLWEPEDAEMAAENAALLTPGVSLSQMERSECTELTIFTMSGLTLDLWRIGHIYDSLDSRSADYEHFARLFDESGDLGLHPDFEECLISGTHVTIIDRARIAPAWRRQGGVGRLLIAHLLRLVAGRTAVVATHPYPIDIPEEERDDEARKVREMAAVQRTWRSLGFEPFREDLYVMQPHLRAHEDATKRLEQALASYL
ncbi:hypothetical protein [Streptomyces sp. SID13588]|uniref:hypothetical protein n=1 Tax=Streptomyces sp. SID13588 TaxID=2706051 RepID=UPI0013C98A74|nr:hypothetical protein [Streptomyces sp. SID13588]NEA77144.1 hypothetical protein [Streptomyces sp. SID13588]